MTAKVFFNTIRTNLRSIVFYLSAAAVILFFINGLINYAAYTQSNIHKYLANYSLNALSITVPVFLGVVSSIDILRDRKNRFLDITKTSGIRLTQYFCGKISAYLLFGFVITFAVAYAGCVLTPLISEEMPAHDYSTLQIIYLVFVKTLLQAIPVILVFTALGVFVSLLFKSTIAGIVAVIFYAVGQYLIAYSGSGRTFEYFLWNIYKVPQIISSYVYYWDRIGFDDKYFSNFSLEYVRGFAPTLPAFIITAAAAVALFTGSYVLLHKTSDTL